LHRSFEPYAEPDGGWTVLDDRGQSDGIARPVAEGCKRAHPDEVPER
jgi:hypothetical protein